MSHTINVSSDQHSECGQATIPHQEESNERVSAKAVVGAAMGLWLPW